VSSDAQHGVVAAALRVVAIEEAACVPAATFSDAERRYAASKSDPLRRLAARLAAKRAAAELLGVAPAEVEVLPARGGPPGLRLTPAAERAREALGARRVLLSLTHGRSHAAAAVLLLA
jgi:phosphopantetheinyl transferase (holo-ACP synthase)